MMPLQCCLTAIYRVHLMRQNACSVAHRDLTLPVGFCRRGRPRVQEDRQFHGRAGLVPVPGEGCLEISTAPQLREPGGQVPRAAGKTTPGTRLMVDREVRPAREGRRAGDFLWRLRRSHPTPNPKP